MRTNTTKGIALRNSKGSRPERAKRVEGFTLIELLVVIAIIGILAGIVLVSLGGARTSARDAKRQSDMRNIQLAMEVYMNDNNAYVASATMPTAIGTAMTTVPKDPQATGSCAGSYCWEDNAASTQDFCVYALLEGGKATNVIPAMLAGPGGVKEASDLDINNNDAVDADEVTLAACE